MDNCLRMDWCSSLPGPGTELVPPLNITRGEVEEAVGILEQSLQEWDP